jgi:hypothetical protein
MSEDVPLSVGYMLKFIREFIATNEDRKFNFYRIIIPSGADWTWITDVPTWITFITLKLEKARSSET